MSAKGWVHGRLCHIREHLSNFNWIFFFFMRINHAWNFVSMKYFFFFWIVLCRVSPMKPFLYAYAYSYCYFVSFPRRDFNWKRLFHFLCYKYTMTAMPGSLGNLAPRWQCWLHGSWCTSEHTQSQETNNQSLTEFHIESSHLINIFGRLCDFDVASITAFPWNRHQFVLFVCLCLFANSFSYSYRALSFILLHIIIKLKANFTVF